jgi:curli biogenesis system outer membrane secretion channel CsgG
MTMSLIRRASRIVMPAAACLVLASGAAAQPSPAARPPSTFIVAPFDTSRTGWMPPPRLGETLAELLAAHLATGGDVRVIDPVWLPASSGPTADTTARVFERAQHAGVDYVVLGSVTRLSIERQSSSRAGLLPVPIAGGLVRKQKTETVLGLTARVVDVRTGQIVGSATSQGGGTHQNTSGGGLAVIGKLPLLGGGGSSATGFQDRLLDEAVQEAIAVVAGEITAVALRLGRDAGTADVALPRP